MSLLRSITHSQTLVHEISAKIHTASPADTLDLLTALSTELNRLQTLAQGLNKKTALDTEPQTKSGCYIFADQKGFFCPHCYDNNARKVATKRMNSRLRVCPLCHSSIKA